MEAKESLNLGCLLARFPCKTLVRLDEENIDWLPRLQSVHPRHMVRAICLAVDAIETEAVRLRCTAWIRCWLIPIDGTQTWSFYRFSEALSLHDCPAVMARIASSLTALDSNKIEAPYAWIARGSVFYACILAEGEANRTLGRYYVYLITWTTHPLIAISCKPRIHRRLLEAILLAMKNSSFYLDPLSHGPIDAAFQEAVDIISRLSPEAELQRSTAGHQQAWADLAAEPHRQQRSSAPSRQAENPPDVVAARPILSCVYCRVDFPTKETLSRHFKDAHPPEAKLQYFCSRCAYWSFARSDIQRHSRIHESEGSCSSDSSSPLMSQEDIAYE